MDISIIIFLLGGLFLGWSLGANDAANVFGTAVGTRMVRFKTAAIICSIFVILGAIISGAGTTETLGKLGAINALPGAFRPDSLLSRFDLMFIVLDNVDAESDRHVANHVLSSHQYRFRDQDTSIKSVDVLKPPDLIDQNEFHGEGWSMTYSFLIF